MPQIKHNFKPSYLEARKKGRLKEKIILSREMLKECVMCPLACRAKRSEGMIGICEIGLQPNISQYFVSRGEEAVICGRHGSGTIFMNGFKLPCNYCENYEASLAGEKKEIAVKDLAEAMLTLQKHGAYNINFVNPSNQAPQILEALDLAIEGGLEIPLIYNTSGYDAIETLRLMEGIVDIYISEFRFWKPEVYQKFCHLANYQAVVRAAIVEMHRQVGDIKLNKDGVAERGILIRHLVLPNNLADTNYITHFIANEVSKDTYVSISGDYSPTGKADHYPELNRKITFEELRDAAKTAIEQGLTRGIKLA